MYKIFIEWFQNLIYGANDFVNWLITPIGIGSLSFTPLMLLTFGGLTAYLLVAVIKWIAS